LSLLFVICSVIYRLVVLLSERASLEANHQAALSQAQNVSRELQRRLDQSDDNQKKKVNL
jgi:hypothetical protein